MNERNKESLSALMDGEADELEIRRVLNQLDKDDELRNHWKNYHLMGSLMRDESFDGLDLTRGINQILDGELAPSGAGDISIPKSAREGHVKRSRNAWYKPLTSVAVAASVTLAVLLGVQSIEPDKGLGLVDNRANTLQAPQGELTASNLTTEEQQELESAQQQLQDYILQNSSDTNEEKKGILPFARVVEFQSQGK
ncbi:MAG: sigma-E factor negative regulatory protein RseA [Oleispira sp.]|jgi:sigma-E factor negative regulatory protein RseA